MSRYSSATWKPIHKRSSSALKKDIVSLHTMVGNMAGTWGYFDTGAGGRGVYSHILVGGIWGEDADAKLDGVAWQIQDTDFRAAANLDGNDHIVSIETADNAARPIAPWTPKQQAKLVQLLADANRQDGIPLVLIPDSKRGRRGIGYHRLGCDPYRAAGGELWSGAYGKDCPTDPRIAQLPGLIVRAIALTNGNTATEGFLMALTEAQQADLYADVQDLKVQFAKLDRRTNWQTALMQAAVAKLGAPVPAYDMRTDNGYPAPANMETIEGALSRLAVDPAELQSALVKAMSDLPEVELTPDAITRVAQSTATLLTGDVSPADPKGV